MTTSEVCLDSSQEAGVHTEVPKLVQARDYNFAMAMFEIACHGNAFRAT